MVWYPEMKKLEVEYWNEGQMENRLDTKRRVVAIESVDGIGYGRCDAEWCDSCRIESPAHTIVDMGEHALVGSWFHLHMVNSDGIQWSVETQGMVEYVSANREGTAVLIAEAIKRYTDSEP